MSQDSLHRVIFADYSSGENFELTNVPVIKMKSVKSHYNEFHGAANFVYCNCIPIGMNLVTLYFIRGFAYISL